MCVSVTHVMWCVFSNTPWFPRHRCCLRRSWGRTARTGWMYRYDHVTVSPCIKSTSSVYGVLSLSLSRFVQNLLLHCSVISLFPGVPGVKMATFCCRIFYYVPPLSSVLSCSCPAPSVHLCLLGVSSSCPGTSSTVSIFSLILMHTYLQKNFDCSSEIWQNSGFVRRKKKPWKFFL